MCNIDTIKKADLPLSPVVSLYFITATQRAFCSALLLPCGRGLSFRCEHLKLTWGPVLRLLAAMKPVVRRLSQPLPSLLPRLDSSSARSRQGHVHHVEALQGVWCARERCQERTTVRMNVWCARERYQERTTVRMNVWCARERCQERTTVRMNATMRFTVWDRNITSDARGSGGTQWVPEGVVVHKVYRKGAPVLAHTTFENGKARMRCLSHANPRGSYARIQAPSRAHASSKMAASGNFSSSPVCTPRCMQSTASTNPYWLMCLLPHSSFSSEPSAAGSDATTNAARPSSATVASAAVELPRSRSHLIPLVYVLWCCCG